MKKAQISAFILIGVVLVLLFAGAFFAVDAMQSANKETLFTPEGYIQHCLKIGTQDALETLARHTTVPQSLTPLSLANPVDKSMCIRPATQNNEQTLITIETVKQEFPKTINNHFLKCLGDYEPLTKQGYQITSPAQPLTDLTFTPEKLVVETQFPIQFVKNGNSVTIDPLYLAMQSEFKDIHKRISDSTDNYLTTKEFALEQWNKEPQTVLFTPHENKVVAVAIDESSNLYQPVNYTFVFS